MVNTSQDFNHPKSVFPGAIGVFDKMTDNEETFLIILYFVLFIIVSCVLYIAAHMIDDLIRNQGDKTKRCGMVGKTESETCV